jgi:hypothetical protein
MAGTTGITMLPAHAILVILDRYSEAVGMDALDIAGHLSEVGAAALTPEEIDRFLELMQLAGWTMAKPRVGEGYRRYRHTVLGTAQTAKLGERLDNSDLEQPRKDVAGAKLRTGWRGLERRVEHGRGSAM